VKANRNPRTGQVGSSYKTPV